MLFTNSDIFDSVQALQRAGDEEGLLGYAVAVNLRRLSAELTEYAQKRDALLQQYGRDAGAGQYTLTAEAVEAYTEALRPYAELQTEVEVMQIPAAVFCSGKLTSSQMGVLLWMVKEE